MFCRLWKSISELLLGYRLHTWRKLSRQIYNRTSIETGFPLIWIFMWFEIFLDLETIEKVLLTGKNTWKLLKLNSFLKKRQLWQVTKVNLWNKVSVCDGWLSEIILLETYTPEGGSLALKKCLSSCMKVIDYNVVSAAQMYQY